MNVRTITENLFAGVLALACLNTSAAPPLSQAEQHAVAAEASAFGQAVLSDAQDDMPTFTENSGERGAGRVNISGITMDAGKLVPHADKTKADRLNNLADSANDLNALHSKTEEHWAQSANDRSIHGQAVRTAERSTTDAMAIRPSVQNDDLIWESSLPAIGEGQSGKVLGQDQGQCTTTTRVERRPSPGTITEETTCDRIPPVDESAWCTREWKDVPLIKEEIRTKYGVLSVNNETGGNMCTRTRKVTAQTSTAQGTRTATLGINNNIGGLSCTRWRTVQQGSAPPPSNNQGYIDSVATALGSGMDCVSHVMVPIPPAPADAQFQVMSLMPGRTAQLVSVWNTGSSFLVAMQVTKNGGMQELACSLDETPVRISWNGSGGGGGAPPKTFGIQETGNCGDPGTAACPVKWSCTQSAPARIGGIPVTASDVQGLAALFPGASNTCLRGELKRQCPGTDGQSSNISIADLIPPNVTHISNFQWTVTNPQSGVNVTLLEAPSAANNWVAKFNVSNSKQNAAKPQVKLTWTTHQTTLQWSVVDSGNCSQTGTQSFSSMSMNAAPASHCPAVWSCTQSAPTTLDGIHVTPGMVSVLPRLFPGAPATCVSAKLTRRDGNLRSLLSGAESSNRRVGADAHAADLRQRLAGRIQRHAQQLELHPQSGQCPHHLQSKDHHDRKENCR